MRRQTHYNLGDWVEYMYRGFGWVDAKISKVDVVDYGEFKYRLWLPDLGVMLRDVHADELRYSSRLANAPVILKMNVLKQDPLKNDLQEASHHTEINHRRAIDPPVRGRSRNRVLNDTRLRAQSATGQKHKQKTKALSRMNDQRAASLPPGGYTWPKLFAEVIRFLTDDRCRNEMMVPESKDNEVPDKYLHNFQNAHSSNLNEVDYEVQTEKDRFYKGGYQHDNDSDNLELLLRTPVVDKGSQGLQIFLGNRKELNLHLLSQPK